MSIGQGFAHNEVRAMTNTNTVSLWSNAININDDSYTLNIWNAVERAQRGKFYANKAKEDAFKSMTKEAIAQMTADEVKAKADQINALLAANPYTAGMSINVFKDMKMKGLEKDYLSGGRENDDEQVGWKFSLSIDNNVSDIWVSNAEIEAKKNYYLSPKSFVFYPVHSNLQVALIKGLKFNLALSNSDKATMIPITFNMEVQLPYKVKFPRKMDINAATGAYFSAVAANMAAIEMIYSKTPYVSGPLTPRLFTELMEATLKPLLPGSRVLPYLSTPGVPAYDPIWEEVYLPD